MVGQLRHFKEIADHAAEQHAGAVLVIEAEGQLLQVGEEIPAHVRLGENAHLVAQHRDHIIQKALQHIGQDQDPHHHKEGGIQLLRQIQLHGTAGDIGEHQVDDRHQDGADHVDRKELFMMSYIRNKDFQGFL